MTAPRGRSSGPGIESWHCFSAGPFYDPDRISLGPLVGLDEHLVEPGAGFDWHAHAGVHIVSWVLAGALRHEDSFGVARVVGPGELFVQATGDGIRHAETNESTEQPLRFVQLTVLADAPPRVWTIAPPATVAGVHIEAVPGRVAVTVPDGRRLVVALD